MGRKNSGGHKRKLPFWVRRGSVPFCSVAWRIGRPFSFCLFCFRSGPRWRTCTSMGSRVPVANPEGSIQTNGGSRRNSSGVRLYVQGYIGGRMKEREVASISGEDGGDREI